MDDDIRRAREHMCEELHDAVQSRRVKDEIELMGGIERSYKAQRYKEEDEGEGYSNHYPYPMAYARQRRMDNGQYGRSYRGERGYSRADGDKKAIMNDVADILETATEDQIEAMRQMLNTIKR